MAWDKGQARDFARQIRGSYGRGPGSAWGWMPQDAREAAAAEFVLRIVLGQVARAVKVEDVQHLFDAVRTELKLPVSLMADALQAPDAVGMDADASGVHEMEPPHRGDGERGGR